MTSFGGKIYQYNEIVFLSVNRPLNQVGLSINSIEEILAINAPLPGEYFVSSFTYIFASKGVKNTAIAIPHRKLRKTSMGGKAVFIPVTLKLLS